VRWLSSVWIYRTQVVRAAYERHPPSRRALVRYEDLLADPAMALERVCAALGLHVPPLRLASIAQAQSYDRVSTADKGRGKVVRAANPGGWRTSMSADEQAAMLEIMGEALAELGYVPSAIAA